MPNKKAKQPNASNMTAMHSRTQSKTYSLISDEKLRSLYAAMLGCRLLEERTLREDRTRRPLKQLPVARPSRPAVGQEAVVVGTTIDLLPEDTIAGPGSEVILRPTRTRVSGKAALAQQELEQSRRNLTAFAASNGTQLTIATGIALCNKDLGTQRVTVAFGDADAKSVPSWMEALHLAGLHQLPILFVLRSANPGVKPTESAATLSVILEQAQLAGVISIPVDETDVVAMYRVGFESIARARKGTGATLILGTAYRLEGKDAARKIETKPDPIERMEAYLSGKNLFSEKWKASLIKATLGKSS